MMIRHIVAVLSLCIASTAYSMTHDLNRKLLSHSSQPVNCESQIRKLQVLQKFIFGMKTEDCGQQNAALKELIRACCNELNLIRESIKQNDNNIAIGAHENLSRINTVFLEHVHQLQSTSQSIHALQNLFYLLCKKLPQALENTDTRDTDSVLREIQLIENRVGLAVRGATALRRTAQWLVDAVSHQLERVSVTAGQEIKNFRPCDTISQVVADAQTALKQHCDSFREAVCEAHENRQRRERTGTPHPPQW